MRSIALFLLLAAACEEKSKAPPPPANTPPPIASGLEGIDASILGEPADPPAPAGDLKAELERFVNVDACVAERAKLDPLVGDALGAIGYETFLRDACRLLEAAKEKKRDTCDRIDSSALRARCQSGVAMVAENPDLCPLQFEGLVTRGRNPSCVAVASKDPRLCVSESRAPLRAACEAMVLRDAAKCDVLLPNQRPQCQREVARWRSVISNPLEGLEKLPTVRGKLVVRGNTGTPDPPVRETDVGPDFVRGVVIVTSRSRMRIELGTVVESEVARIAASPQKKPRVGLALLLDSQTGKLEGKPTLQKLEIELPGDAPLVSPPAQCDCKISTARADTKRGGEVAVAIEGTLSSAGRSFKISIDLATFVRDIVSELPNARVFPPAIATPVVGPSSAGPSVHPNLRDGGR